MSTAPQRPSASVGSVRNVAVSFANKLDSGELLTGTPTVVDANPNSPEDLTISNIVVNTAVLTINGVSVAVGEAVQCSVSGFVAASFPYTLTVTVGTDATPAQTLIGTIIINKAS